jgi:hypothetical protein
MFRPVGAHAGPTSQENGSAVQEAGTGNADRAGKSNGAPYSVVLG